MKRPGKCLLLAVTLGLIACTSKTAGQDTSVKTLVVNGKSVDVGILQAGSCSYVDIEGLAEILGGSVVFAPNQITLTITEPTATPVGAGSLPQNREGEDTSTPEMSKEFQQMAIATLAEIREWRGAVAAVVSSGLSVTGTWPEDYHDRVAGDLLQATLAATTVADNQAV